MLVKGVAYETHYLGLTLERGEEMSPREAQAALCHEEVTILMK